MPGSDAPDTSTPDADELAVERTPPDDAFELLAHETRFRILETLNDADEPLSFSDLRQRVGVDDPGQFNYHLGKLVGRFVSDDDGYELSAAGWRVVGAVQSGGYTKALDADPVETSAACVTCGSEMELRFPGDKVELWCRECDETNMELPIPAGIFEGVAPSEAATVVDNWLKRLHSTAEYGFCSNCDGVLDRTVRLPGDEDALDELDEHDDAAAVRYTCDQCGFGWYSSFAYAVVLHPALVGVHYEHGVDLRATPFWDLDWLATDETTVESRDPLRIAVSVTLDGETVEFTFDDDLDVVEERHI